MRILIFQKTAGLILGGIVLLGIGFFLNQKNSLKNTSSQKISMLKSPCRGLIQNLKNHDSQKQRLNLLTHLMENPIDMVVQDIRGEVIDLYCYRGRKKVLINLWATWCAPCIEELPSLSLLSQKFSQNLLVLAITTEPAERVHAFLQKAFSDLSPNLKIVNINLKLKNRYFPEDSLPVTYIFDQKGRLENKVIGSQDWMQVDFSDIQ